MKAFVITDIHSYYGLMMQALKRVGFDVNNPEHIIINCGDLLDRGPKSIECLRFMNDMHKQGKAYLIKGNHEQLLEELLDHVRKPMSHDFSNGTIKTIKQLYKGIYGENVKLSELNKAIDELSDSKDLRYYLNNLKYYYKFKDYIFTHGWLPIKEDKINMNFETSEEGWDKAMWYNGMKM